MRIRRLGPGLRTLFPALLAVSLTASAATISGTVTESDGQRPVANLVLVLRARDSTVERRAVTDHRGRFVFLGVRPAESYSLNSESGRGGFHPDLLRVRASEHLMLHGTPVQHCEWLYWTERPDPSVKASTYPLESRTSIRLCE